MDTEARSRLRHHLAIIDHDVEPVAAKYAAHIQCSAGCSDCCHQSFEVSALEGAYLREGLNGLAPEVRADILDRARRYTPHTRTPCPVLSATGTCRLYGFRPRICRKYGIPLWSPERPERVDTCPKNFRDVTDIDAELIVEPQVRWAEAWIELRETYPGAVRKAPIAEHLRATVTKVSTAAPDDA